MDLSYSESERAFEAEVRSFLAEKVPPHITKKVAGGKRLSRQDYVDWHGLLAAKGWLASPWPEAFGGPGWGPVEKHIFDMECALAHAPRIVPFGVTMLRAFWTDRIGGVRVIRNPVLARTLPRSRPALCARVITTS